VISPLRTNTGLLDKCRQFYHWITDRAVWKQVNEVPETAAYVKQELAKAALLNTQPKILGLKWSTAVHSQILFF